LHDRSSSSGISSVKETPVFLDKNENPFRLPPSLREEIRQLISSIDLNRYPDPEGKRLKQVLSELTGVPEENLVIGNGGDEILSMLFTAFIEKGSRVVSLAPTFSQYPELCRRHKAEWIPVPLEIREKEIDFDEDLFLATVSSTSPDLILVDTPNNPTGKVLSNNFLSRLAERASGLVVVDEAYGEFSISTFLETFRDRTVPGKLCILKTLSKAWGMAGLRIGYAACSPSVCSGIERVRDLYNVGLLSQEIGAIVLQYREWMESRVLSIRYMRDQLIQVINRIPGWHAYNSDSNFVLVRSDFPKSLLRDEMEEAAIHVKFLDLDAPGNWIRVSIGREDELGRFVSLIEKIR
jgi:histidinol-phosphate aminotransferase